MADAKADAKTDGKKKGFFDRFKKDKKAEDKKQ